MTNNPSLEPELEHQKDSSWFMITLTLAALAVLGYAIWPLIPRSFGL